MLEKGNEIKAKVIDDTDAYVQMHFKALNQLDGFRKNFMQEEEEMKETEQQATILKSKELSDKILLSSILFFSATRVIYVVLTVLIFNNSFWV